MTEKEALPKNCPCGYNRLWCRVHGEPRMTFKALKHQKYPPASSVKDASVFVLFAQETVAILAGERVLVPLDLSVRVRRRFIVRICTRVKLRAKGLWASSIPEFIDPYYMGEIVVRLENTSENAIIVQAGEPLLELEPIPDYRAPTGCGTPATAGSVVDSLDLESIPDGKVPLGLSGSATRVHPNTLTTSTPYTESLPADIARVEKFYDAVDRFCLSFFAWWPVHAVVGAGWARGEFIAAAKDDSTEPHTVRLCLYGHLPPVRRAPYGDDVVTHTSCCFNPDKPFSDTNYRFVYDLAHVPDLAKEYMSAGEVLWVSYDRVGNLRKGFGRIV